MEHKIENLLSRGVEAVYPSKDVLAQKLKSGQKLRVYWGVDPTGALQLHHTIPMRKLRDFQELGHHVILLIGSFTAMIGDPTGKTKTRVPLTKEQVVENARLYAELAKGILDFEHNPPEIVFNGDWLEKLSFKDVVELASHFTVQQMIERDMFQERLKAGLPISLHEFMYPLMQGYDSVAIRCDVEIGGTDQIFNMLAGRELLKDYLGKEKMVVATSLLTDDTGKKTSTSDGTGVSLELSPENLYGKIMSLPDGFLKNLYYLATDTPQQEIDQMVTDMMQGGNPMHYKKRLAFLLTRTFHGDSAAAQAQSVFESTVQGDAIPDEMPEIVVSEASLAARDLLVRLNLVSSNGEAKRMIEEHAVAIYAPDVSERKLDNPKEEITVVDGMVVRVGKRKFARIRQS